MRLQKPEFGRYIPTMAGLEEMGKGDTGLIRNICPRVVNVGGTVAIPLGMEHNVEMTLIIDLYGQEISCLAHAITNVGHETATAWGAGNEDMPAFFNIEREAGAPRFPGEWTPRGRVTGSPYSVAEPVIGVFTLAGLTRFEFPFIAFVEKATLRWSCMKGEHERYEPD